MVRSAGAQVDAPDEDAVAKVRDDHARDVRTERVDNVVQ
jgi:hypothetical protein